MTNEPKSAEPSLRKVLNVRLFGQLSAAFQTALKAAHPDLVLGGERLLVLLKEHPDVKVGGKSFWEAYYAAQEELDRRPPPAVKRGDFVEIKGRVFRIGFVDVETRRVTTERVDARGHIISSCPCGADYPDGSALQPITPSAIDAGDWPPIPERTTDGLSRARFVSRHHHLHLIAAGLDDDD